MNPTAIRQKEKSGLAMPLALLAVVLLLIMGTGVLRLGISGRIFAIRATSDITARAAADAALTMALFAMNEKLGTLPWDDDLPSATDQHLVGTNATFSYTITGDLSNGYLVEAIGKSGVAVRQVSGTLRLRGPFEAAVFVKNLLNMNNGGTIDWYNYDADDFNFAVGTGSTGENSITLKSGVTINGDLVVGVGGDPDVVIKSKESLTVDDRIYALSDVYATPPVSVPTTLQSLPSKGTLKVSREIGTSEKYDTIDLAGTITINGPVELYVTGNFTLGNSSKLQVVSTNPDAYLYLFVGGDIECKNGSEINNETKMAGKLRIYGLNTCKMIDLKNSVDLYGAIYAPQANVVLHNSVNIHGSIIAKSYDQKKKANLLYDASLRDTNVSDPGVRFILKRWSE